jgi:hypothetical protein
MSDDRSTKLAGELEGAAEQSIAWWRMILSQPIDAENGSLLRAQGVAAAAAVNAQLRADAMRLRSMRADKALERLLVMLAAKEKCVPASMHLLVSHETI